MNTYQYQVLRFLPDRVSGEFVNLGIVVYDQKKKQLAGKFYQKITRVSSFFPSINSRYLASTLKFLQKEFEIICDKFKNELSFEKIESIEDITKKVLPKDDSALFFTDSKKLLEVSLDIALSDLYDKFVLSYIHVDERDYVTDKEVWNNLYKEIFEKHKIIEHFRHHTVKTEMDSWEFEKAWKNGVWNCFETVSFDLVKADSIREKTYKWWGKLSDLKTSEEPIHVYLLSKLPVGYPELSNIIKKKLNNAEHGKNVTIELVSEKDAEKFAKRIKKEIEQHKS
jgi:Protein of unknown function (DUF3037)